MRLSEFDFELPEDLIAQQPLAVRDASRMLVVNRARATWRDDEFASFASYLDAGDTVVINNTRVFPARLVGVKDVTNANVELFLIQRLHDEHDTWRVLARPARRLSKGTRLTFAGGRLGAEVVGVEAEGNRIVRFETTENFQDVLEEIGRTPLPPYIKRQDEALNADKNRYQTIYARASERGGAIAAPTAGLHWTPRTFEELKERQVNIVEITLHVGYGTFAPVRVEDLDEHKVASETYSISETAAEIINRTRAQNRRIIAVGTTTTRALESACDDKGRIKAVTEAETALTITPGYKFKIVDALVTNFHLPRSSLLVLVASFAGLNLTLDAYRHAVEKKYRFYSYGDCMLII